MAAMIRVIVRSSVVAAAALAGLVVAEPASAHVTITASDSRAGAFALLTVSVPHGCDGSPTTKVAIQLPDAITEVTPTRNALYDLDVVTTELDEPITADDGDEITERVSQVVYTAKEPLPDGQRDAFELSVQIPEDAAGETLAFPTVQTCETGSTAWTEEAADGGSADDLEHPAPAILVRPPSAAASAVDTDEPADRTVVGLAVAGLVAGLAGLALGGIAYARTRGVRSVAGARPEE
jgi:uncharacterized protein YcnI